MSNDYFDNPHFFRGTSTVLSDMEMFIVGFVSEKAWDGNGVDVDRLSSEEKRELNRRLTIHWKIALEAQDVVAHPTSRG